MDTIYIENDVAAHPRTRAILERHATARHVIIDRYTDVFNATAQNFRIQKNNPALILAAKHGNRVLPTPAAYHIGGKHNYYFSHMFNCLYDCRYCFLQGMYRSANYVVFINYDEFIQDIKAVSQQHNEPSWFFSGYDCDSLAMEPVTHFMQTCLDAFEQIPKANLEIRTKSTQIRSLLARESIPNCVIAYSLSPQAVIEAEEHKTSSLAKRIHSLQQLQHRGWKIGLRFDPLIAADNFDKLYEELFEQVFSALDTDAIHSVSLGLFRLPKAFHKKMLKLYPESALLSAKLVPTGQGNDTLLSYESSVERDMLAFGEQQLMRYISRDQYFPCQSVS